MPPSSAELYAKVRRAKKVRVQAYNLKGELYEMTCEDLPARVWQHEIDHLDGKLFVDYLSELKRQRVRVRLEKERRQRADGQSTAPAATPTLTQTLSASASLAPYTVQVGDTCAEIAGRFAADINRFRELKATETPR